MLADLKKHGASAIAAIARRLRLSYEAARQHVTALERDGQVQAATAGGAARGRPAQAYALTAAGDHAFPKGYDALTVELIDTLVATQGPRALKDVLGAMTAARVAQWQPKLKGLPLSERIKALKEVYVAGDPHTTVELRNGTPYLVERNCPFLNVARERPALCSVTVSTLRQLLGVKVTREERFQNGDGCCAFRIDATMPLKPVERAFALEDTPSD